MGYNEIAEIVTIWWREIQDNSGASARLRRCATPEEAALLPETHRLRVRLPGWVKIEIVATIAGLVAHIKNDAGLNFALALATPKEKNGRVPLSENRFRHLLACRDWDELYRNLRRSLDIINGQVILRSFIDSVFEWDKEFTGVFHKPGQGIKFNLSRDYYTEAMKHE